MNNIYNNEDYILYKKTPNFIVSFITILILLFILLIIIVNFKYKTYKKYHVLYHDNYFYFETDILYDLKDMYYDGKKYSYTVESIDNNGNNYLVKLKSDLSLEWIKNDNEIDIYFLYKKTSIFEEVFKKYGKGD